MRFRAGTAWRRDIPPMSLLSLLLASCTACAPSEPQVTPSSDAERGYTTQLEAPSPDYKVLMAAPPKGQSAPMWRKATAPLPRDAKAIGRLWITRLEQRGALMGYGLTGKTPDGSARSIDTLLTEREFDAWVAENGWTVPKHIEWRFQNELVAPRVSEAAARRIRFWPASNSRTGWQLEAAEMGRVFVRDGCFFVRRFDGSEKLAWFHAETGVGLDQQGYLILIDRSTGQPTARLGEDMSWAGPNHVDQNDPGLAKLHEACGGGEVHGVGNPQAQERLFVQYPHLRNPSQPPPPPPVSPPPPPKTGSDGLSLN